MSTYASPPTDEEKYRYLNGPQKRWLLVLQYLSFVGVIISFGGFATSSYWTFPFLIPLILLIVEQSIALFTATRPRAVTLEQHQERVASWTPSHWPSVDIFLPTAGEELDVLRNTMGHLTGLVWHGELKVYILDDSDRHAVRDIATRFGFEYLARPGSEFKKAGNLRYGEAHSSGEFVVIFDADFVPRPDFLTELLPYFDDPTIGIIQSPQFFDTDKSLNWVQRTAGATQELFYRFIQPSRDHFQAAICVGSSAVYRRAALEAIGGFPKIGTSEDIYTGYEMQKLGYSTRYVPVVVSKGVCPDNIDSFIAQQYRWCEGSMGILATADFHNNTKMSLGGRLCFWSGFLYYIGTALNALIIPLPAIIMAWFYPEWVRWWNTVWLFGVIVLWMIAYPLVMRGRWRIEVLRLQTVYGFAHVFNIVDLIKNQVVDWHPTGSKERPPIAVVVKRFYTYYLGVALVVLVVGLLVRTTQDGIVRFLGMLLLTALNIYVVGPLVWAGLKDELRLRQRTPHLAVMQNEEMAA